MKTAFFEVENWEKAYLKRKLRMHELKLYSDTLNTGNAHEAQDAEVVSTFIYSVIDRSVLEQLRALKLIATRSTGFDHIDVKECQRRGIRVCNVPSYGENTVAEHTFALILSLYRRLHRACLKRLASDFSLEGLRGFDLKGKTLGVVGTGHIGLHVIRIARGFGMNVLAYDVRPNQLLAEVLGFKYITIEELLSQSHIVTLHVPYNDHTHHLIDRDKIAIMRKGAYLINTARGAVVDTQALIDALDSGRLAGAGLDVLEGEDILKEDRAVLCGQFKCQLPHSLNMNNLLLQNESVVYTPHIAFNSQESLERIIDTTIQNINGFESGDKCQEVQVIG